MSGRVWIPRNSKEVLEIRKHLRDNKDRVCANILSFIKDKYEDNVQFECAELLFMPDCFFLWQVPGDTSGSFIAYPIDIYIDKWKGITYLPHSGARLFVTNESFVDFYGAQTVNYRSSATLSQPIRNTKKNKECILEQCRKHKLINDTGDVALIYEHGRTSGIITSGSGAIAARFKIAQSLEMSVKYVSNKISSIDLSYVHYIQSDVSGYLQVELEN